MPARAPSTPASHDPSLLGTPFSYAVVSSPKYQTLPSRSCAYQSDVSSSSSPSLVTVSRTTRVVTPSTTLVLLVTSTTMSSTPSGDVLRYTHLIPGSYGR